MAALKNFEKDSWQWTFWGNAQSVFKMYLPNKEIWKDLYKWHLDHAIIEDSDEYWQDLVDSTNRVQKKYEKEPHNELVIALLVEVSLRLNDEWKKSKGRTHGNDILLG